MIEGEAGVRDGGTGEMAEGRAEERAEERKLVSRALKRSSCW